MALVHALALSGLALSASCRRDVAAVEGDLARCDPMAVASPAPVTSLHDTPGQLRLVGGGLRTSPDDGRGFNLTAVWNREASPRRVVLSLTHMGAVQVSGCASVVVRADARRIEGSTRTSAGPGPDGTQTLEESFEASFEASAMAPVATSSCVAIDLCGTLFPLHARQVRGLRAFVEAVQREGR